MKPFTTNIILTVFIILAAQSGHALANPIYFDFGSRVYSAPNTGQTSNSYWTVYFAPASSTTTGSAEIDNSVGNHVAGSGSITIAGINWQVQSNSDPLSIGTPSTFNAQPFKLALTVTDEASHAQGTFNFQGAFSGSEGPYTSGGTLNFSPSIQTLDLGHNRYTVDLSQQTSWVTNANQMWMLEGAYGGGYGVPAQVTVQSLPVQSAPEPASVTLASLGLATLIGGFFMGTGANGMRCASRLKRLVR
jgi:hypothetical protein